MLFQLDNVRFFELEKKLVLELEIRCFRKNVFFSSKNWIFELARFFEPENTNFRARDKVFSKKISS